MASQRVNPLSATWRIYPSSKWSSQWPYDGYIRHGWTTSCGRGWDLATLECFWRGYRGTIFVRSSKLSLFFPELCPFRRVFSFPRAFERFGAKCSSSGAFSLDDVWGLFFENFAPSPGIFLRTLTTTTSISWKFPFFFPKQSQFYLPDDPKSEQSTLVMVRQKLEWKLDFRALVRSSAEGPSIVVAIGTSRARWSMVQKRKKKNTRKSACNCAKAQPFIIYKLASFEEPVSETRRRYRFALCRMVRLQRGDSEEKQSSVTFPVLITEA